MIKDSSLCEFKKHIYLGAVTSQLREDQYDIIKRYILYSEEYFNESDFEEISFIIKRGETFIKMFPEYGKEQTFQLNLENIKEFIFSRTIKEAY